MDSDKKRVGIIGAGISGLMAIKYCLEEGLIPVCFEQHDKIGGVWYYTEHERENQTASAFQNLHTNDPKDRMAFSDFPAPNHYPEFWSLFQYCEYLTSYAKHFDLLRYIRFNRTVTRVRKAGDYDVTGRWEVVSQSQDKDAEETEVVDAVSVCSGSFSKGRMPDFNGLSDFKGMVSYLDTMEFMTEVVHGKVIHSTQYRKPEQFNGQKVLVIGSRFSAGDVASDITKLAKQVYLSVGRGMHVLPRILNGVGISLNFQRCQLFTSQEKIGRAMMAIAASLFDHAKYGIDTSLNPMFDGNVALNDELKYHLFTGRIIVVPRVKTFTEDSAVFADGTTQKLDAVVMATGYNIDMTFVDCPDIQENRPAKFLLYKGTFPVSDKHHTLAVFCGNGIPGAYVYAAEIAARWQARVFAGKCHLPPREKMRKMAGERRDFFMKKCLGRLQMTEFAAAEEIASELGVRPDLYRLIFRSPLLAYKVYFGPPITAHYRLVGPGALQSARDHVHHVFDKHFPDDIPNKMRSLVWYSSLGAILATAAYAILNR